jgi:hypothetical protein
MGLPAIPTRHQDSEAHRQRISEVVNGVTSFQFDDSRVLTQAEIAAGVTPVNYAYLPGKAQRHGWSSTNSAADNTTAIENAIAVAQQEGVTNFNGGTIDLPRGSFDVEDFAIPAYVIVRGAGKRATVLNFAGTGFCVSLGSAAKTNVRKYGCGISDLSIICTHKDGHVIQCVETVGAYARRIYAEGTTTASRSNILLNLDGGDAASFNNLFVDIEGLHFEVGYRFATSGSEKTTNCCFLSCSTTGDKASFANSIGLRVTNTQGSGSVWIGGNFEDCGTGAKFENGCKSMTLHGARFEGNTVDAEAQSTAGSITISGSFINEALITDTGNNIALVSNVNGSSLHGASQLQGAHTMRAVVNGEIPLTLEGFAGYTTDLMLRIINSAGTVKWAVRHDGTMQGVTGISATTTASKNLRGQATFAAGTTVAVTFASAEPDSAYYVELTAQADPVGRLWVSGKGTGGFTINNSSSTSIDVDWILIR